MPTHFSALFGAFALVLLGASGACTTSSHQFHDAAGGFAGSDSAGNAGASPNGAAGALAFGGLDGGGTGGESAAQECQSGEKQSCWGAHDGTPLPTPIPKVEIGSCRLGTRFCGTDSKFGNCLGAVGPKSADSCDIPGNDDDCDGVPNGGCACVDGQTRSCGKNVGSCKAGTQTCVGQSWGSCEGEVGPKALDSCVVDGNDDNCNGTKNDDCPCVGTKSQPCGDCGAQDCDPTARQWGACHAAQDPTCASTTQTRDCAADGTFTYTACKYACAMGQCTGSCTPRDLRCMTSPERRQTCNDQGVWTTLETCGTGTLCQGQGTACVEPCPGKKTCPGNVCVPLGGCCSDADCANNFACVGGTCSIDTCQVGFNGPCGGACTKGCCSVNDCPQHPNMGRSCNSQHQCLYGCNLGYGNCDGSDANGCEVDLGSGTVAGATVRNCGACGTTCDFTNSTGSGCMTLANLCSQASCFAEFKPPGDTTDQFAYKCPTLAPHAVLERGDCDTGGVYDCEPGYGDCNYDPSDGCESSGAAVTGSCQTTPFWPGTN